MEPSWPVFIACNMSRVSPPRHSPMMMRSGRIRNALRTRSVAVMAPVPSILDGRVSSRTTCSCWSWSSAASSMVTTRWSFCMKLLNVFSKVVLPEPVPPLIMMLSLALIHPSKSITISGVNALKFSNPSSLTGFEPNRRIETHAPSSASGGMIALTREPSSKRASTMGLVSSTRRPTLETIRSMICIKCALSRNSTSVFTNCPPRSTKMFLGPLIKISLIEGSFSKNSRGPSPRVSSNTSSTILSRSDRLRNVFSLSHKCSTTRRISRLKDSPFRSPTRDKSILSTKR